mmetsp:Transcript_10408/g.27273  ORF Transcript_10408/g.27273 Transcript_10408/m.27273 type:complete len:109 (-) Transcript_10408:916-1242(-)
MFACACVQHDKRTRGGTGKNNSEVGKLVIKEKLYVRVCVSHIQMGTDRNIQKTKQKQKLALFSTTTSWSPWSLIVTVSSLRSTSTSSHAVRKGQLLHYCSRFHPYYPT